MDLEQRQGKSGVRSRIDHDLEEVFIGENQMLNWVSGVSRWGECGTTRKGEVQALPEIVQT